MGEEREGEFEATDSMRGRNGTESVDGKKCVLLNRPAPFGNGTERSIFGRRNESLESVGAIRQRNGTE